jgi:hypothetical protein
MAKIYEWCYKAEKGQIIADNLKEAKRQIANKFGNPIKIPKGTVLKKIGLAKGKSPAKVEEVETPAPSRKIVTDTLPNGTVLTGPGGKTYTVGQKGKKPFWFQEAVLKHQGIKGVKAAETVVSKAFNDDVGNAPELRFGGYELKNALILQRESHITGPVSLVYETPGSERNMCFVGDEAEIILPSKTKVWRLFGEWSIA